MPVITYTGDNSQLIVGLNTNVESHKHEVGDSVPGASGKTVVNHNIVGLVIGCISDIGFTLLVVHAIP